MSEADTGKRILGEVVRVVFSNLASVVAVLAGVATLLMFVVFVYDGFGLSRYDRTVVSFLILIGFLVIVGALGLYHFYNKTTDLAERVDELEGAGGLTPLLCLAREILSIDDGRAFDSDHVFESIEETIDQTGDHTYFEREFVGRVKVGAGPSDGITIRYRSDYKLRQADVRGTVSATVTRGNGDPETYDGLEPELLLESPYDAVLNLPFGDGVELDGGDEFELTYTCDRMGRPPSETESIVEMHFPLHRFARVNRFDATIRLPATFRTEQAARISNIPDLTEQRSLFRVEDLDVSTDVEVTKGEQGDHVRYWLQADHCGGSLFVLRFLRE
jgi:hypothetical protein